MTKNNVITAVVASAMLMAIGPVSKAAAQDLSSCSSRMDNLANEWHAISFPTPDKPGVAVVIGRNNHEASGGQISYIQNLIRSAARLCRDGDNAQANQQADQAHSAIAATLRGGSRG
jgi:hypothetical protein